MYFFHSLYSSSPSYVRTRTRRNNNRTNALGECRNKERYNKIHESLEPVLLLLRCMKREKNTNTHGGF